MTTAYDVAVDPSLVICVREDTYFSPTLIDDIELLMNPDCALTTSRNKPYMFYSMFSGLRLELNKAVPLDNDGTFIEGIRYIQRKEK